MTFGTTLVISSHLHLGLPSSCFFYSHSVNLSAFPYVPHSPPISSELIWSFYHISWLRIMKLLITPFFPAFFYFFSHRHKYLNERHISELSHLYILRVTWGYAYSADRFRFRFRFRQSAPEGRNDSGKPSDSDCLGRPAGARHHYAHLHC